jgi:hypothetical protein
MDKTILESQIDIESIIDLCYDFGCEKTSVDQFCTLYRVEYQATKPLNYRVRDQIAPILEDIDLLCNGYEEVPVSQEDTMMFEQAISLFKIDLQKRIETISGYRHGYFLWLKETEFCVEKLGIDMAEYTRSLGGLICDIRRVSSLYGDDLVSQSEKLIEQIIDRNQDIPIESKAILRYIGRTDEFTLIHGKVYIALSREDEFYRVVDESYEDYIYSFKVFEYLGSLDRSMELDYSDQEARFFEDHFYPKGNKQPVVVYITQLYRATIEKIMNSLEEELNISYLDLCERYCHKSLSLYPFSETQKRKRD